MSRCNVFVVGADEFNLATLRSLPVSEGCDFQPLLSFEETQHPEDLTLLDRAVEQLEASPHSPDGIVGWWDMPTSGIVARLCERFHLPGHSLRDVMACEHKYWSRLLQNDATGVGVPEFRLVDPFAEGEVPKIDLDYPFWLKPIKSFQSHLAFRIDNDHDLARAMTAIRGGIKRMAEPFNRLLEETTLPPEVAHINGYHCIAEQLISGHQCTVEGYVMNGEVTPYGLIDSVRYEGVSSFARYEYPSMLPPVAQEQIRQAAIRLVTAIGLRQGTFNVEFFWDEQTGRPWVIEVNPRISQSHATLFEKVDGNTHHEIAVDLGLGRRPIWSPGTGRFRCAAKCFLRVFESGVVTRVPAESELERLERQIPGTVIHPTVRVGEHLLDLADQDSYSYTLAEIHIGADSRDELLERYAACIEALPFEVSGEPVVTMQPAG